MTTPSKHAALIKAWADSATIQCRSSARPEWEDLGAPGDDTQPGWFEDFEYRVKPSNLVFYTALVDFAGRLLLTEPSTSRAAALDETREAITNLIRLELSPDGGHIVSITMEKP